MDENLRAYMRLIEKRTREHERAFGMLYAAGLYGACAGIIRQEIDSLMRADYLAFSVPLADRNGLCREALTGERWTQITAKKKIVPIKDVELKQYAADNHSWVSVAYEYSSKFIHLTNLWDYDGPDPLMTISANDRETMRSYLEMYHCFVRTDVTMADLIEYLPKVFEKIRDNVEGYVDQRDGLVLGAQ